MPCMFGTFRDDAVFALVLLFFFITIFDHKVSFEPFLEEKLPLDALCI